MSDEELMADLLRYGSVKEIKPNRPGLFLSQALRTTKDFGNKVQLGYPPLTGTMGVGDLVMGQAPEALEDYAYGFPPYKGKGWATRVDPRVIDVAALPLVGSGIMGAGRIGAKSLMAKALVGEEGVAMNEARRNFLKQGSALTGAGALGGVAGVDLVKALTKEVAPAVAVQAGKGTLGGYLGAKAMEWTKKYANDFVGRANWEYSGSEFIDSLKHIISDPGVMKSLDKVLEQGKGNVVDPELIAKLHTNLSPHGFEIYSIKNANPYPDLGGAVHETIGELIRKINSGDKELLQQYEALYVSKKLPKGAPEELKYIEPEEILRNKSPLGELQTQIRSANSRFDRKLGDKYKAEYYKEHPEELE